MVCPSNGSCPVDLSGPCTGMPMMPHGRPYKSRMGTIPKGQPQASIVDSRLHCGCPWLPFQILPRAHVGFERATMGHHAIHGYARMGPAQIMVRSWPVKSHDRHCKGFDWATLARLGTLIKSCTGPSRGRYLGLNTNSYFRIPPPPCRI